MTRHRFRFRRSTLALAVIAMALSFPAIARGEDQQAPSSPKSREPGRTRSFEIAVGGEFLTPQGLGTATATMTSNNQSGTPYTYFSLNGTRALAPAFRGRLGYNITSMLTVEGGIVIARSDVQGNVTGDVEGGTAGVLTDRLTQYFVDVSALAHLRRMTFSSGAGVPFLEVGGGYLRQLHTDALAMNTGQIYHFGGGVTYMFSRRSGSRLTGLGLRADARLYVPRKGYSFGSTQPLFAAVGGSLVVAF